MTMKNSYLFAVGVVLTLGTVALGCDDSNGSSGAGHRDAAVDYSPPGTGGAGGSGGAIASGSGGNAGGAAAGGARTVTSTGGVSGGALAGGAAGQGTEGGAMDSGGAAPDAPVDTRPAETDGGAADVGEADAEGPGACTSDHDCPQSQVCGYQADISCSGQAHCIPTQFCNSVTVGCGCDGGIVLVGCGVASRPFSGAGACAGSTGGASGSSTPVDVTQLMGKEVPACAPGYAHPDICCQGAPYRATTCTEDLMRPFDGCGAEELVYPDPKTCCSLANKTTCERAAPDPAADAGQRSSCQNPCYPGAYPPPPPLDSFLCVFGTGMSVASKEPWCSLCTSPIQWCPPPCPAGWSAPPGGQVDLCCQADPSGKPFCFSQAGYIGSRNGGGVGESDGSSCRYELFLGNGNSYVVSCDLTASAKCTCLTNGITTKEYSTQANTSVVDGCGISQCGFPSP
jgi:hypothetical protein